MDLVPCLLHVHIGKHPQIHESDEDGPLSEVLESRGIRKLWVIVVVHKICRLGWL